MPHGAERATIRAGDLATIKARAPARRHVYVSGMPTGRLGAFALAIGLGATAVACAPGAGQSNGVKMGEALAFAAAAGAAQVAQTVAQENARRNAPVTHASGYGVSPACDNEGQYACVTIAPGSGASPAPEHEMSNDEGRDFVLGYLNGVRKLNSLPLLVRDDSLDAFAKDGSGDLARDHQPGGHRARHTEDFPTGGAEVQGPFDGTPPGSLEDQLGQVLLQMIGEGSGGPHHDVLLRPEWRKLGVGIVESDGRAYLTIDLSR